MLYPNFRPNTRSKQQTFRTVVCSQNRPFTDRCRALRRVGRTPAVGPGLRPKSHSRGRRETSLRSAPTLTTRGGFHVRGSTSSGFPQSPFAVKFVDEFNEEESLSPVGLPADSDWVLYGPNVYDPVMIHNPFVYQLSRDI